VKEEDAKNAIAVYSSKFKGLSFCKMNETKDQCQE